VADRPELKAVYLITGGDRPKVETAVARLRRHFDEGAVERASALEATGADVVGLCNAGSLFGDARLVLVGHVDGRRNADNRLVNGWKAADVAAVSEYLTSPAPTTVLALVAEETRKDSPLAKAVASSGQVLDYPALKKNVLQWVGARFKEAGVRAEPDACAALVQLVGDDDRRALASEIDKIATWAAGEPIGAREVEDLVAATAETPTFALTDAWAARDPAELLDAAERILGRSAKARRDETARIAAALGSHATKLKTAKRLSAQGVKSADAMGSLGTRSRYYADKLYEQAENFSGEGLRRATVRLAELDLALKGGSRLAPDFELQRALIDLAE
jgi:DNA polymerase III subunit delta